MACSAFLMLRCLGLRRRLEGFGDYATSYKFSKINAPLRNSERGVLRPPDLSGWLCSTSPLWALRQQIDESPQCGIDCLGIGEIGSDIFIEYDSTFYGNEFMNHGCSIFTLHLHRVALFTGRMMLSAHPAGEIDRSDVVGVIVFFICLPFCRQCRARTDDSYARSLLGVGDHKQPALIRQSDVDEAVLGFRVMRIREVSITWKDTPALRGLFPADRCCRWLDIRFIPSKALPPALSL